MTAERLATYTGTVNQELSRIGLPPPRYMSRALPLYAQVAHYPARFNRLLIYRGNTLHTGDIPDDLELTGDPRTGRSSVNTFIWLEI